MAIKTYRLKLSLRPSEISTDPIHGELVCHDPGGTEFYEVVDTTSEEGAISYLLRAFSVFSRAIATSYKEKEPEKTKKAQPKGKGGK